MPTLAEAASYGVPTNLNQTTSVNGTTLTWNDNGNLDASVTGGVTTDYQWTFGNRLWKVVKPTSTTEYAYDSTDRRTVAVEDGVMTRTLWSGADEVGQYASAGGLVRRFIPDGSGAMDARLAMAAADGTVSWFHTNHQGSVVAMSNASGAAVAFANYSEYGKFGTDASGNPLTAPPGGSPFGYTGRQWDAKAGLYNYRARYYDPALGVFLSMDPIGTKDDPNLYMYVANDPVNLTDPTGMCVFALPCPVPPPAVTLPTAAEVGGAIATVARASPVVVFVTVVFTPSPLGDGTCDANPGVCGRATVHNNDANGADAPPLPGGIVGVQDGRGGRNRSRGQMSGPLAPEHGGTGDADQDFEVLGGPNSAPPPEGSTLPPGSRQAPNGVQIRPGSRGAGPRIDIPGTETKPPETLHYPPRPQ